MKKMYECGLCGQVYIKEQSAIDCFFEHERQAEVYEIFECKECGLHFSKKNLCVEHERKHERKCKKHKRRDK